MNTEHSEFGEEQLTLNQRVRGSSPRAPSNEINDLADFDHSFGRVG